MADDAEPPVASEPDPAAAEPAEPEKPRADPLAEPEPEPAPATVPTPAEAPTPAPAPKRRGRPPGSKNRPKPPKTVPAEEAVPAPPPEPEQPPKAASPPAEPAPSQPAPEPVRMTPAQERALRYMQRQDRYMERNEPQMLRQFSKMYPSYNLNPLLRSRHQQLVEAQAFNQWLSDRRLRQDGETYYADELGRMTEAVNRRIPQLRYAPAERAGVQRMARDVAAGRNTSESCMAALLEMKLSLQLAKREGTWLLWSPEAGLPLGYEEELEDEEGQEILRLLGGGGRPAGQRAELPGQEEREQWYRERPADGEYYRIQRELLQELEWGEERETTLQFYKFTSGAAGELSLRWDPVANSESVQRARESSSYAHRPLHNVKMEERRSNGFRVKPSFGQVLGYIQEGEPLTLDLPNPKASIYTQPRPLKRPTRVTVELRFHALRNDGLNPPRPPTLGGAAAGAAAATRSVTENQTMLALRGALVGTAWTIERELNAASHLMGWGAATGGGTDSHALRPSMTTDILTLNGAQESGAVDHYFQEQEDPAAGGLQDRHGIGKRAQESPLRRPQAQTLFGLNNVPIPSSPAGERCRVSRQSRGD
ncbi:hypothetical protein AK812_SmicGene37208 [Symbiodinium microadriaticum]|uniref:Uncharacterized protein n=1 Tax=Symbiodinium microadriaticum TaxID=2951 RepID=A0A1Q9CGV2_SYMMI|nr:hypothetical protein AK812_SmicGene37208 [Symbiodinium microadriaticum]